jgi:hypothetical protein
VAGLLFLDLGAVGIGGTIIERNNQFKYLLFGQWLIIAREKYTAVLLKWNLI